jgi:inosose dehydratase
MHRRTLHRRDLLRAGAAAAVAAPGLQAAALAQGQDRPAGGNPWHGLKVGVASYTFRKSPVDATIKGIQRVGLAYVSIKDFHLPLKSTAEERRSVAQRFRDAGITPLSCGVINMTNDTAAIRQAFEYARDAGIPTIVCSPDPGSMAVLDQMVKEFNIRIAIHNHGPGDKKFPSPYDVMKAVESYDKRIGLCIDVGHTARIGVDPAEAILKCRERLYDLHLKDVTSKTAEGKSTEQGRGVLDTPAMLRALVQIRFPHLVSFEYEKDADEPIPGLAESVGYTKGVLTGIR